MNNISLIFVLIFLLFLSAFFSASETAFSSLNRIKLKSLANNGDLKASKTLKIIDDFPKFITSVLIGNNIVNIASATIATVLFTRIYQEEGALISTIVVTVVVIIFGEICPKRLAKMRPEVFAMSVTPLIQFFIFLFTPLTYIFNGIGNLIEKIFKIEEDNDFDSDELVTIVEEAEEQGDMDEHEADLITNAIEFNDQDVGDVYTPRVDVIACSNNDSLDDIERKFRDTGYSRLPYYKDSIDHIIGLIHEKDFYPIFYQKSNKWINDILQKVVYTNENVKVSTVLRQLQSEQSHLAVVVDEFGGTQGILTMEDILEELVGEIYDEHDEIIEYFTKINDKTYKVNCDGDFEEFIELFKITDIEENQYKTVSGWVIDEFNKIPKKGDSFKYNNLIINVIDANEKEVKEILVKID